MRETNWEICRLGYSQTSQGTPNCSKIILVFMAKLSVWQALNESHPPRGHLSLAPRGFPLSITPRSIIWSIYSPCWWEVFLWDSHEYFTKYEYGWETSLLCQRNKVYWEVNEAASLHSREYQRRKEGRMWRHVQETPSMVSPRAQIAEVWHLQQQTGSTFNWRSLSGSWWRLSLLVGSAKPGRFWQTWLSWWYFLMVMEVLPK